METRQEAVNKILELQEKYKDLPKQGTKEWLELRKTRFGGSELEKLMKNQMSSLLKDKVYGAQFHGNTFTKHGKLFEQVGTKLIEIIYDTHVYEFASIPNEDYKVFSYSPDGLAVIKFKDKYYIVLVEIKSPFLTKPDKAIPLKYVPQVMSGMANFGCVNIGLFVNVVYRVCSRNELDDPLAFNTKHHSKDNYPDGLEPTAVGYFKVYKTEKAVLEFNRFLSIVHKISKMKVKCSDTEEDSGFHPDEFAYKPTDDQILLSSTILDLGSQDFDQSRILDMVERKLLNFEFGNIYINKNIKDHHHPTKKSKEHYFRSYKNCAPLLYNDMVDAEMETGDDEEFIGFYCFKVFEADFIKVKKDANYLHKLKDIFASSETLLKSIMLDPDPIKKYEQMFKK